MKQAICIILIFLMTFSAVTGCTSGMPNNTTQDKTASHSGVNEKSGDETKSIDPDGKKTNADVIVVYFSCTGNTRTIAKTIQNELNADIYEIKAKNPYTEDDIKYYTDCRADREQKDPSARPEIAGDLPDISGYNIVFLGYPIWHGQAPKIVYTFLESVDMSGKIIIPFCTSGSSPIGSSATNLHPLTSDAKWKDGKRFAAEASKEEIHNWISGLYLQNMK